MSGPLESIILSGLHAKALAEGMDLNKVDDFMKFSMHVDRLSMQAQQTITHMVNKYKCSCGKPKAPSEQSVVVREQE